MYLLMQIPRGEGDVGKGGGGVWQMSARGGDLAVLKIFLSSSSVFKNMVNTSGITNLI